MLLLTAGCAIFRHPPAAVSQPQAAATQPDPTPPDPAQPAARPVAPATPQPAPAAATAPPVTTPAPPAARSDAPPVARTPAPAARTPAPAALAPKPAAATVAAPPVAVAPTTLDLDALKAQLRATKAIGIFTKIALKNQVDDLMKQFREYYQGTSTLTMTQLRRSYDLLMMKVLSLLQDADQKLASAIVSSREAIWGLLADQKKFDALQI